MGDVHNHVLGFTTLLAQIPRAIPVVQVGDLPLYPHVELEHGPLRPPRPVFFIDGNHHYFPETVGLSRPTEIRSGLTYMPRGTVAHIDGTAVGFLGGADSIIDRAWRLPGIDFWPEVESVAERDIERLLKNVRRVGGIDILVTHTPPASVTCAMVSGPPHPSALLVEQAWEGVGQVDLICGHMHASFCDHHVQVLNQLEIAVRETSTERNHEPNNLPGTR